MQFFFSLGRCAQLGSREGEMGKYMVTQEKVSKYNTLYKYVDRGLLERLSGWRFPVSKPTDGEEV